MTDPSAVLAAIRDVGLAAVIILLSLWGIWKVIIPAIIDQQQQQTDFYVAEIKSLRQEAREDKQRMFEAFNQNSEVNKALQAALNNISAQIVELSRDVVALQEKVDSISKEQTNV
jgi:uncharacterized coiled-coil DUF342 family protein